MVILGFMDGMLKFVLPVIWLDAAHTMQYEEQIGTLYIASALSAANEVYLLGFLLSSENEDWETWTVFLRKLKDACPCLCRVDKTTGMFPFVPISDCNKGLQPTLGDVFPDITKHIEANVEQLFGAQRAKFVLEVARTFSTQLFLSMPGSWNLLLQDTQNKLTDCERTHHGWTRTWNFCLDAES